MAAGSSCCASPFHTAANRLEWNLRTESASLSNVQRGAVPAADSLLQPPLQFSRAPSPSSAPLSIQNVLPPGKRVARAKASASRADAHVSASLLLVTGHGMHGPAVQWLSAARVPTSAGESELDG
eukprot:scaffold26231_cov29-Tisochrysis_lutea.AAC.3